MVCLERLLCPLVVLVLYLAVPFCAQNSTQPISNSTINSQIPSNSCVPVVFPQKGINGENIRTANGTFQASLIKPNAVTSLNQTELSSNSINNSTIVNCDSINVNATDDDSTSKVSAGNETIFNSPAVTNESTTPADTNTEEVANSTVPLVEDENNATLTQNVTNVDALNTPNNNSNATPTNSSKKTDTEVPDMMVSPEVPPVNLTDEISESSSNISFGPGESVDEETELIDDGQNTEDILRNSSLQNDELSRAGVPLVQGQLAAILAGVFVVISVTAYVGLLSWRRYLENRYGTRQMLVNEDEFNDDMRHFSI